MTGRDYATAECFALIFVHIGHNIRFTLKTNFQPADDMRRSLATQAMNAVLVATFAWTSMFADISGALLRSSGGVNVDGKPVPSSLALFAGDKISTTSKGVATITAAGSILTLSPGTSVIYGTNSVEMECGHMAVTAMQPGLTAKIRNLQVSPTMAEMENVVHSRDADVFTGNTQHGAAGAYHIRCNS